MLRPRSSPRCWRSSSVGFDLKNVPPAVIAKRPHGLHRHDRRDARRQPARRSAHLALDMVKLGRRPPRRPSIVGQSLRSSPQLAALANGVAAHAMDYDFTFLTGQSVSAVIPGAAAAGRDQPARRRPRFVAAFIVGCEGPRRGLRARQAHGSPTTAAGTRPASSARWRRPRPAPGS